ncbi:MotA/TolQ/ExbB proton channel family protein [Eubacteriales bacterium OttesenSCG-928-N14]|nr:MotA/TolQ/ExbB proton channel family protein [Eubacteriales bacterium OttesenSCG-928-N14]
MATTLIGFLAGFACVVIGILWAGASLGDYIDAASIFVTVGGTIAATFMSFPLHQFKSALAAAKQTFQKKEVDLTESIDTILRIANIARKEGLLALENAMGDIDDEFLQKGIMLIVDGADPELIKTVMETEIYFIQQRHANSQAVLLQASSFGPAFGMIGTLIGLVNMLNKLDDPSTLGPQMAVALITTFYGVLMANLIFTPIAKQLKVMSDDETNAKELLLEGLLSIQDGENPRIIRDKLTSFLSRTQLHDYDAREANQQRRPDSQEVE